MAYATTHLTIRVQARGGKFLADDIGGAHVTVRDVRSGVLLASGVTRGTSGTLVTPEKLAGFLPEASKCVVVTPAIPTKPPQAATLAQIHWLVADADSSKFVAALDIQESTLLEISVYGSLGGLQSAHRVTTTTWLAPGLPGPAEPGFVVEIPGLVVQVQQPATHSALSSVPATVPIEANVAMMCGCPINHGEPWVPEDFDVAATVGVVGEPKSALRLPLVFDSKTGVSGRFTGSYEVEKADYYQVSIVAVQKSTGNTGSGLATFFYEPS